MKEQTDSVTYKDITYIVILDEKGTAWFIDAFNNKLNARTNVGQKNPIHTIEDAKSAVIEMLKGLGR